jgi:hypothetical protein
VAIEGIEYSGNHEFFGTEIYSFLELVLTNMFTGHILKPRISKCGFDKPGEKVMIDIIDMNMDMDMMDSPCWRKILAEADRVLAECNSSMEDVWSIALSRCSNRMYALSN